MLLILYQSDWPIQTAKIVSVFNFHGDLWVVNGTYSNTNSKKQGEESTSVPAAP